MSLITDALKAADRERRADSGLTSPRRLVAQTGFFGTPQAPKPRFVLPSSYRLGLGLAATLAIALAAFYVVRRPAAAEAEQAVGRDVRAQLPVEARAGRPAADSLAAGDGTAPVGRRSPLGGDVQSSAQHRVAPTGAQPGTDPAPATIAAAVTQQGAAAVAGPHQTGAPLLPAPVGAATDPSAPSATEAAPQAALPRPTPGGLRIALDGAAPSSGRATARAALEAQRRGDLPQARDLYRQVIAAGAAGAAVHNNLGAVLRQTGDLPGAVASYRRAIELDPSLAEGWLNLGTALAEQSQADAATAAFQRALALDPRNATVRVRLAQQYRALGAHADARRLLEEALGLAPDQPDAHYLLGQVLEELGDRQGAAREFLEFLRVGHGFAPAFVEQVRRHATWLGAGR